jgi:BirA family biotin operon repressor/biotin-[acetyl-CoA-carboxylase] ligase
MDLSTHFWWQTEEVTTHTYDLHSVHSTQDFALSLVPSRKESHWTWVRAESQKAGRGQFHRAWHSPLGGLYQTLICSWPSDPRWTSLVGALAVCQAIEELYGVKTEIKWKNDIFFNRKKLAGVLAEIVEHDGKKWLLLGIGLNVNGTVQSLNVDQKITSLKEELSKEVTKKELIQNIDKFLYAELKEIMEQGMTEKKLDLLCEKMAYRGESVYVRTAQGIFQGVLQGISLCGQVVVDGEPHTIFRLGKTVADVA